MATTTLRVAVIGCAHGELDDVYAAVEEASSRGERPVQLVVCCGDFEASRNVNDLQTMACPPKYRRLNSFWKYYAGIKLAPVLTVFVGGNHEAANHLQELPYGGWVAPNIFYLGHAGCVRIGGVRIAGLSGIYDARNFNTGRHERVPYSRDTMRSVYHVKRWDFERLEALAMMSSSTAGTNKPVVDVFLSHDWPHNAANSGDVGSLLRRKPFFREEVARGELGSPIGTRLMFLLRPSFWFSAHMHVKHAGVVWHGAPVGAAAAAAAPAPASAPPRDANEIDLDDDDAADAAAPAPPPPPAPSPPQQQHPHATRFLALDKILPDREFMQVLEIPASVPVSPEEVVFPVLRYDPDWLAIIKMTHAATPLERTLPPATGPLGSTLCTPARVAEARAFVASTFGADAVMDERFVIPTNFAITAPAAQSTVIPPYASQPLAPGGNPQQDAFLAVMGLAHAETVPWKP